jgi:hypothetical protein
MKLGGDQDNQRFRNDLNDKMKKTGDMMKKFQTDLEDFRTVSVPYEQNVGKFNLFKLLFRKPGMTNMKPSTTNS